MSEGVANLEAVPANPAPLSGAGAAEFQAAASRIATAVNGFIQGKAEVVGLNVDWYLEKPLRPEVMRDVLSKVAERIHG